MTLSGHLGAGTLFVALPKDHASPVLEVDVLLAQNTPLFRTDAGSVRPR